MSFRDKVVIVTGAGRGIGYSVALTYATAGANVILAEKDPKTGVDAKKKIKTSGGTAVFIKTDISNPEEVSKMVYNALKLFDTIDILINNAGISKWVSPYELPLEEWDRIFSTNLRGAFICSRETAKVMREHGGGSIVNIASTRALMSEPFSEAYAASKGGIIALTHALASSFAPDHIRVNCISPGWIETGNYSKLREQDHEQHFSGRVGRPEDIARACLYLTSQGNEFINGTNIIIDGGMTRKMIYEP